MTDESYDVVVVGSGPGGLTTAACLAATGRSVLVLERHDVGGGNLQAFRRVRGSATYEFDVGVHYVGDCGPGGAIPTILASLGVGERLTFLSLDPDCFDDVRLPDGLHIRVPADWDLYRDRVIDALPEDADGIRRYFEVLRALAAELPLRFAPGAPTPSLDAWKERTLEELFDECGLSVPARGALNHWSGLYGGAPSQTAVAMQASVVDHYMRGAYYPAGGGQAIAARLVQAIEAAGGEVRTLAEVERIVVEDGRVTGVRLRSGSTIRTSLVVSNADHRRTVNELVGREHWSSATLAWADAAVMTVGLFCLYVILDRDVSDWPNSNYHVFPDADIEQLYRQLDCGTVPEQVPAYVAIASRKDPANTLLSPPGQTNLQIMTLAPRGYAFWDVARGPAQGGRYRRAAGYRDAKAELTKRLLETAETVLGPLGDLIVYLEAATPVTHERYTHSTGGTSYGYRHSPDQSAANRPSYRTEIDGLWCVGANTEHAHGIAGTMAGGLVCAGEILDRPLLVEVMLGEQLLSPDSVSADPPAFDAVEVSRGAALRERRSAGRAERSAARG